MHLKYVVFLTILLLNLPLCAVDLNNTNQILEEATQATKSLQQEFEIELNQTKETLSPIEINNSVLTPSEIIEIREINTTLLQEEPELELNQTKKTVAPLDINNTTLTPSEIIEIREVNTTLLKEDNQTITNKLEVSEILENNESHETNVSEKSFTESNRTVVIENNQTIEHNLTTEDNNINILTINNERNTTLKTIESNETMDLNKTKEDEVEGKMIRGLIIFKTRIKPFCEMTGEEFAKQYIQEDWDDLYHEKEFKKEVLKACPNIERRYKESWTPHLYQFTLEYASDSDAIPEC